jgi:hypothetical protein
LPFLDFQSRPKRKNKNFPSRSSDNGHQLHALKNTKDGFSLPSKTKGQRGQAMRGAHGHSKISGFILLLLLSIMGVVQALTDCQIMHDWLPGMFDGTGTACCEQSGILCSGSGWGRIKQMYVALTNLPLDFSNPKSSQEIYRRLLEILVFSKFSFSAITNS